MVAVVHKVAAIACLVVVAATGLAAVDIACIVAAVGMAYMALGSIDLAVVDMVVAIGLVVVEAAAYFLLQCSLYDREGTKDL